MSDSSDTSSGGRNRLVWPEPSPAGPRQVSLAPNSTGGFASITLSQGRIYFAQVSHGPSSSYIQIVGGDVDGGLSLVGLRLELCRG